MSRRGWGGAADGEVILPEQLGKRLRSKIRQSSHRGAWGMQDLLRRSKLKIKDVQQKIINIVTNFKACQLTNAVANPKSPGSQLQGESQS